MHFKGISPRLLLSIPTILLQMFCFAIGSSLRLQFSLSCMKTLAIGITFPDHIVGPESATQKQGAERIHWQTSGGSRQGVVMPGEWMAWEADLQSLATGSLPVITRLSLFSPQLHSLSPGVRESGIISQHSHHQAKSWLDWAGIHSPC